MRKVTEKAAQALRNGVNMTSGNTYVKRFTHDTAMVGLYLHGNRIATYGLGILTISDCGWQTNTTKERLNGILSVFGIKGHIFQHKGEWLYQDHETLTNTAWHGTETFEL